MEGSDFIFTRRVNYCYRRLLKLASFTEHCKEESPNGFLIEFILVSSHGNKLYQAGRVLRTDVKPSKAPAAGQQSDCACFLSGVPGLQKEQHPPVTARLSMWPWGHLCAAGLWA